MMRLPARILFDRYDTERKKEERGKERRMDTELLPCPERCYRFESGQLGSRDDTGEVQRLEADVRDHQYHRDDQGDVNALVPGSV
jgi:hypothetical protein